MKHIILIILLTLGVWGDKIGVPYVDTREAVSQSATLSPDGKTFYTYANNTLTHWSLNPVKVLDSVKIEDLDIVNGKWHRIYVTPDQQKIIFVTRKILALYNLKQKTIIKKTIEFHPTTNLIGSDFFVVDSKKRIYKINPNTLEVLMMDKLITSTEDVDPPEHIFATKNQDRLTVVTNRQFLAIDKNSLQIVKRFKRTHYDGDAFISFDAHYFKSTLNYEMRIFEDIFDLEEQKLVDHSNLVMLPYPYFWSTRSCFSNLIIHEDRSFYNKKGVLLGNLYIFKNNSWLFITSDGYFNGSPESRTYLYMNKSLLINDTTYNKFHKQINLKD